MSKFNADGRLILSVMLGPYDLHPVGSRQWAECLTMHLQGNLERLERNSDPSYVLQVLRDALTTTPHPWEVFPEEANGDPEAWLQMATLLSWSELEARVKRLDPDGWAQIAKHQQEWEAHPEHGRTHGGDRRSESFNTGATGVERDDDRARGIRRRLQKRANAGDEQAAELVSQLAEGDISVNQAAIAAGMRQQYIRVRTDDPAKAAASIVERMGNEWAAQLAAQLQEALTVK